MFDSRLKSQNVGLEVLFSTICSQELLSNFPSRFVFNVCIDKRLIKSTCDQTNHKFEILALNYSMKMNPPIES